MEGKGEVRRIKDKGCKGSSVTTQQSLQCKKAQRCARATCSGRKMECDRPQLFQKKKQTTLIKMSKTLPKPKPPSFQTEKNSKPSN